MSFDNLKFDHSTNQFVDSVTGEVAKLNRRDKARLMELFAQKEAEKQEFERKLSNGATADEVNELVKKLGEATGTDLFIGTKRKMFDKTPFSQIIHPNVEYLNQIKYLSDAECAFLFRIAPMLEFGSNCLVIRDVYDLDGLEKTATPSLIADKLGKERANVSRMMNKLKNKGVLGVAETGSFVTSNDKDGKPKTRIVSSRTWFVNPNIICCAEKTNIEKATQRIFKDALKNFIAPGDPDKKHNLPIIFFGYDESKSKDSKGKKDPKPKAKKDKNP